MARYHVVLRAFASVVLLVAGSVCADEIPSYGNRPPVQGELRSVGSDSMNALVTSWIRSFQKLQPEVVIHVSGRGSASAPSALLDGSANLGPMNRPMKGAEVQEFRARLGLEPTSIRTALSAVGVFVATGNPIGSLSLEDLDAIFSATRNRGEARQAERWSDLGVSGPLGGERIMPVGRIEDSYDHVFFRQQVLVLGKFLPDLPLTADTRSTMQTVALNPNAIGFGRLTRIENGVRLVPISREKGEPAVLPTAQEISEEQYPLSRYFRLYVVQYPGRPLDRVTKEFLTFVLSREGQALVENEGFIPLPADVVHEELAKLR